MSHLLKTTFVIVLTFCTLACGNNASHKHADSITAYDDEIPVANEEISAENSESIMNDAYKQVSSKSTSVSASNLNVLLPALGNSVTDTMKNLLRSANIRFRVKNIVQSTMAIEDVVNALGGYIENTRLTTNVKYNSTVQTSHDSIEVTNYCEAVNSIRIRIPNHQFNSVLKQMMPYVDFLDYREITTDDITIDIIRRQLAAQRTADYNSRLKKAVDTKPAKLDNVVDAERNILYAKEQEDNTKIDLLILKNKIEFSTIYLQIYQDNIIDIQQQRIQTPKEEYKPSFGNQFVGAVKNGWQDVQCLVLFIINSWAILLIIGLILFIGYRCYKKRKRQNT